MNPDPLPFGGGFLIADKSAWEKARHPDVRDRWTRAFENGQIGTCAVVELELLYSARSAEEFAQKQADLAALPHFDVGEREFRTAIDALRRLSELQGLYHRLPLPDALIAATAHTNGVGVLHYDKDYERLREVLDFDNQRIAESGTL